MIRKKQKRPKLVKKKKKGTDTLKTLDVLLLNTGLKVEVETRKNERGIAVKLLVLLTTCLCVGTIIWSYLVMNE